MSNLKICYLGAYDSQYPRNQIFRRGLQVNGVEVIECSISAHVRLWKRNVALLLRYLKIPHDFDIIMVAEMNQFVVPLAKALSSLTRKPLIFDIFFSLYDACVKDRQTIDAQSIKAKMFYGIDKLSLALPDLVIADTHQHLEYYHKVFNVSQKKLYVIYVGCDTELFYPLEKPAKDHHTAPFTVTFMGTFIPLHGIEYIIRAAKILAHERDIHFEIIGTGQTYPAIKSLYTRLALRNCSFLGPVSLQELPALLSRGDICLGIFGKTEKAKRVIPNKVYQQLAMKKPVITGDSPAIREIFSHEEHLFLCDMADAESLAEAILRLKNDEALRTRIAANGYRLVTDRFTPQVIGKQVKELMESIL